MKANFDVAVRAEFSVASAAISNDTGQVLAAGSLKLYSTKVNVGEAAAALLAAKLAISLGADRLILKGDSLITVTALKKPNLIEDWTITPIIKDTLLYLSQIPVWEVGKVHRQAIKYHLFLWVLPL